MHIWNMNNEQNEYILSKGQYIEPNWGNPPADPTIKFEFEVGGETYLITAPTEQEALAILRQDPALDKPRLSSLQRPERQA